MTVFGIEAYALIALFAFAGMLAISYPSLRAQQLILRPRTFSEKVATVAG